MNTIKNHHTPHAVTYEAKKKRKKLPIFFFLMCFILMGSTLSFKSGSLPVENANKYFQSTSSAPFSQETLGTLGETEILNLLTQRELEENPELLALTLPLANTSPEIEEPIQSILPAVSHDQPLYLATIADPLGAFSEFSFFKAAPTIIDNGLPLPEIQEEIASISPKKDKVLVEYPNDPRYMMEILDSEKILYSTVEKGDTLGAILNKWLSGTQINAAVEVAKPIYPLTNINIGKTYRIVLDSNDNFIRYEYDKDDTAILVVNGAITSIEEPIEPDGDYKVQYQFTAALELIEYEIQLAHVESTLDYSLFDSVTSVGESAALAIQLANVFSYQIDFFRDPQKGDTFNILVEKRYLDGEFKGYGNMIAAQYMNNKKNYVAYLFTDSDGKKRYYDQEGEALERLFLKTPLDFTRISSGYTMTRKHPIFGDVRPHEGIDYAAPKGTPVRTIGDGTVTYVGWSGGYGNTVIVRHSNGFESQYAHLSSFAKSLKKGDKVDRGQTVAYVGATGNATGPHLDFRIKQNGKFINPDSIIVPRAAPLSPAEKQVYFANVDIVSQYFAGTKSLDAYIAQID